MKRLHGTHQQMAEEVTDREKWKTFLSEFGIAFTVDVHQSGTTIEMFEGDEKVGGYSGFRTRVEFGTDGKFKQIGAWE